MLRLSFDGTTMRALEDIQCRLADTHLQFAYLPATARAEAHTHGLLPRQHRSAGPAAPHASSENEDAA